MSSRVGLLGSDLEDRRGEHVEALGWSSWNDSSAKAIGGVVGGRPGSIRRDYGDPPSSPPGAAKPPWNQTWCESGRMVPLVHSKV
jgi:hypothetical protein